MWGKNEGVLADVKGGFQLKRVLKMLCGGDNTRRRTAAGDDDVCIKERAGAKR